MFPVRKMLPFIAFTTTCFKSHRAWICSLANNIVTRIVLFHYSRFWKGQVFLCGFEPLKSVLLFLLKATPGKLSVCSPALASGDVKTGVQLFICINGKKIFHFEHS